MRSPFSTVRPRKRAVAFVLAVAASLVPAGPALAEDGPSDTAALDALSLFVGGSHEAAQRFGGLGETLVDVRAGQFIGAGTGATKRTLSQGWNETIAKWRGVSAATKQSLPFTIAPHAMLASDALTAVIAPASGGDLRGATSGAVNLAVAGSAVSGGAAAFSALGAGVGATLGSFVPVVGTAAGGIVGGAIGTVAGGFISATAYELYVKGLVASSVEGGIAAVFDVDPLAQAMQAREEHLRAKAALDLKPVWETLHVISADFDIGGVELVAPPRIDYTPGAPMTAAGAPDAGVGLAAYGAIEIKVWAPDYPQYTMPATCTVSGDMLTCAGGSAADVWATDYTFAGRISGNSAEGRFEFSTRFSFPDCAQTWAGHQQVRYDFDPSGALTAVVAPSSHSLVANTCANVTATTATSGEQALVGTWSAAR